MSTADHAKHLAALLRKIKPKQEPEAQTPRAPMDELIYSLLLSDATSSKAEHALHRIRTGVVDDNELRVCRTHELVTMIGKTYPRVEERAMRLHAALSDIYKREYAVTLEPAVKLSKRDAAKYIETLDGLTPFAAKRFLLVLMGVHAMPVDDRLLARLIAAGVAEEGCDAAHASGILERHVKHDDAIATFNALQRWSEEAADAPAKSHKPAAPARAASGARKTTTKAPAKKTASAKH